MLILFGLEKRMKQSQKANLRSPLNIRHNSWYPFDRPHVFAKARVLSVQKVPISSSIQEGEMGDSTTGNKLAKDRCFFRAESAVLYS